jgi:hypothetical protein
MMGRLNHDQGEFFYSCRLDVAVPDDHPVRAIAAVLDLSWVGGHDLSIPFSAIPLGDLRPDEFMLLCVLGVR